MRAPPALHPRSCLRPCAGEAGLWVPPRATPRGPKPSEAREPGFSGSGHFARATAQAAGSGTDASKPSPEALGGPAVGRAQREQMRYWGHLSPGHGFWASPETRLFSELTLSEGIHILAHRARGAQDAPFIWHLLCAGTPGGLALHLDSTLDGGQKLGAGTWADVAGVRVGVHLPCHLGLPRPRLAVPTHPADTQPSPGPAATPCPECALERCGPRISEWKGPRDHRASSHSLDPRAGQGQRAPGRPSEQGQPHGASPGVLPWLNSEMV